MINSPLVLHNKPHDSVIPVDSDVLLAYVLEHGFINLLTVSRSFFVSNLVGVFCDVYVAIYINWTQHSKKWVDISLIQARSQRFRGQGQIMEEQNFFVYSDMRMKE